MVWPSGVLIQKETFSASLFSSSPSSGSPLKPLATKLKRVPGPLTDGVTLGCVAAAAALLPGATARLSSEPASKASTPSTAVRRKRLIIERVFITYTPDSECVTSLLGWTVAPKSISAVALSRATIAERAVAYIYHTVDCEGRYNRGVRLYQMAEAYAFIYTAERSPAHHPPNGRSYATFICV